MTRQCKHCNNCKDIGRSEAQGMNIYGRKHYYCRHSEARSKDPRYTGFVGYGDNSSRSELTLKTTPKWCPLKAGDHA